MPVKANINKYVPIRTYKTFKSSLKTRFKSLKFNAF